MAECGVDGRCRTLWGGDDSTVFKHHNGPVGHGEQAATAPQAPNGPVGHGEQVRQPPLIQGSEPGPPQGKASNGIDIYWQATDAGMSASRDDGGCGEHGAYGAYGGRGRIRGASVGDP